MTEAKLASPRVIVTFADGKPDLDIQTGNPDLVLWDMTRAKHKWPTFQDAPFLWLTFLAWAAARRTGQIGLDVKWEEWRDTLVAHVTAIDDEDEDSETGSPFDAEAGPA